MLAMAGLYEIWRDPDAGRRRPRPVPLDLHGAHHRGRGRPRPHPRPDAADGRAGALVGLARPHRARRRAARSPGPGRARCRSRPTPSRPWSATCATTARSWSSRCPSTTSRPEARRGGRPAAGRAGMMRAWHSRGSSALRTATVGWSPSMRVAPSRPCCSATAPAAASTPPTWRRWRRTCRATACPWSASSSRGGSPGARSRPRRPPSTTGSGPLPRRCARARRWSSAGARPERGRPPGRRASSGRAAACALAFPLHPPGRPETSRLEELLATRVPTLVVQGERDPMGRPEEFPRRRRDDRRSRVATTPCEVPAARPAHAGGGAGHRGGVARWSGWSGRSRGISAAGEVLSVACSPC